MVNVSSLNGMSTAQFVWYAERALESDEVYTVVVSDTASVLHELWRGGRRNADGTFEPRWKDDGDGGQVDIANTPYSELPPKWQAENAAAAESGIQAVLKHEGDMELAAADIHDSWLFRNGEWAEPHQKVPYLELSDAEKEKDRVVARAAWDTLIARL